MSENVTPQPVDVAYGAAEVAELTPRAQITAQYGLTQSIFSAAIGGTITNPDSMFRLESGTTLNNVVSVSSEQQVSYKSGQGLQAQVSALFTQGVTGNTQIAGMITSESLIGFGYKDADFGIIFATDGALEIQELTLTSGAVGSESAVVVIDGNGYTVPITGAGINENAYEIAESLNAQVAGWVFSSNQADVDCMALLPQLGGGVFAFTSASAVGVFVEREANNVPTEELIKKADWNVNPHIDIDPTKGNVYKIQYQYLGFGNTFFSVLDPDTGKYELVHIKKYANTALKPSVPNPIFRVGWATRNSTATLSSVAVSGGSAALFNEGEYIVHGLSDGECTIKSVTSGTIQHVLSIRNRLAFDDKPNRVSLFLNALSVSTEATKITTFYVYKNATVSGALIWEYEDKDKRIAEIASNDTIVTGGDVVACYPIRTDLTVDLSKVIEDLRPTESITIAAEISSGSAADVAASLSFVEDL